MSISRPLSRSKHVCLESSDLLHTQLALAGTHLNHYCYQFLPCAVCGQALRAPLPAETIEMQKLVNTYGKTFHTWQVDRGDPLPYGMYQPPPFG